jgi:hypothetical protein
VSGDFDDAYEMSGQSQILRAMQSVDKRASKKEDPSSSKRQMTFGQRNESDEEEDSRVDKDHELIETSTNSMVNMAISLDPLAANKAFAAVDKNRLAAQKQAMQSAAKSALPQTMLMGSPDPKVKGRASNISKPDYSADEFESDSEEQADKAVPQSGLDKFVVSMGANEDEKE